jgi:hypothetical protein
MVGIKSEAATEISKLMERKRRLDLPKLHISQCDPVYRGRKAYLVIVGDGKERVPSGCVCKKPAGRMFVSWVSKTSHSV